MKKLVSDQIVDYLERRGVEYVFGLCGHTVIAMLDAFSRSTKLRYISVRHEQIAATAADGYARVAHKAGVVICHLGPGLTNATTGVANAAFDSIPMVVIAGDVPSYYYGKHPHQEVNMHCDGSQYDIYKPFVKRAWRVDRPEAFPEILDKAFRLAESGRPGPVLISVPMDMFSREIETDCFERTYMDSHETKKPGLDPEAAKAIAKELIEAKESCHPCRRRCSACSGIQRTAGSRRIPGYPGIPYAYGPELYPGQPSADAGPDRFLGL